MKNVIHQQASDIQHGRTKYILSYVKPEDIKAKKVLDIGCGFGWFEYNMLKYDPQYMVGIDLTEKDIRTAKEGVKDCRVNYKEGSALELPFEDESFDTVVSWDVIEHIPKGTERMMLKEIARVLKKGGSFYLSTPYRSFRGTCLDPAWWLIKHRHYLKENICIMIEDHQNLIVEEMRVRGKMWDILGILNLYISKWIFKRQAFQKDLFDRKVDQEYFGEGGGGGKGTNTLFVKGRKK